MKEIIKKISENGRERLPYKKILIIDIILFIISLLPILYCGMFDYATGDDLLYGTPVRAVIRNGGSFADILKAACKSVADEYLQFQGTWATGFLWRFEPSILGERFYIVTPLIALFSLCGGLAYLTNELLRHWCGLPKSVCSVCYLLVCFFLIQYMPTSKAGLYWYTGMLQYTFPFGLVLFATAWILRYFSTGKKKYYIYTLLVMTYMGGSGYPEIVLSFMILATMVLTGIVYFHDKKAVLLILPLLILTVGFAVSAMAPGNKYRGGSDFGFSIERILITLAQCLYSGVVKGVAFVINVRPMVFLIILVFIITLENLDPGRSRLSFHHPVVTTLLCYLTFCAVFAPEIYAGDDVKAGISGGVYNSYYFVFVSIVMFLTIYLAGSIKIIHPESERAAAVVRQPLMLLIVIICVVFFSHLIGNTVDYKCVKFICSGQLQDFEDQMQERLIILKDDSIKNVILPEMNNEQGPLMHMALTADPNSYTNEVTKNFYNKTSVIAIPRTEYEMKYGSGMK